MLTEPALCALQSDDRSVVVYRTSDWAVLARIDKPYRKMITSTFATRLSFSPDGQFLLTGNSYQSGNHAAVVVQRGQWEDATQLLFLAGHEGERLGRTVIEKGWMWGVYALLHACTV